MNPVTAARAALGRIEDGWRLRLDPVAWSRRLGVQVGQHCRLLDVSRATFGSEPYLVRLGDHVTVTEGVRFVTHDGGVWVFRQQEPDLDIVAPIAVGDNVFLGLRAIVLPGVTIGDNCVVAAGAVVTRDIRANSVVAGVPARFLRSIDDYRGSLVVRERRTKGLNAKHKRAYYEATLKGDATHLRSR